MSNREAVMTFITALQSGDIELAANSMSDEFSMSDFLPEPLTKNEFLVLQSELLTAMPDFSYNLSEPQETDNDTVRAFLQITGTQMNLLDLSALGIQPVQATGIAVTLLQVQASFQVQNGLITMVRVETPAGGGIAGLLQQIGAELPLDHAA